MHSSRHFKKKRKKSMLVAAMDEVTGMTEFLNPSAEGFDCLLKARYGDFCGK